MPVPEDLLKSMLLERGVDADALARRVIATGADVISSPQLLALEHLSDECAEAALHATTIPVIRVSFFAQRFMPRAVILNDAALTLFNTDVRTYVQRLREGNVNMYLHPSCVIARMMLGIHMRFNHIAQAKFHGTYLRSMDGALHASGDDAEASSPAASPSPAAAPGTAAGTSAGGDTARQPAGAPGDTTDDETTKPLNLPLSVKQRTFSATEVVRPLFWPNGAMRNVTIYLLSVHHRYSDFVHDVEPTIVRSVLSMVLEHPEDFADVVKACNDTSEMSVARALLMQLSGAGIRRGGGGSSGGGGGDGHGSDGGSDASASPAATPASAPGDAAAADHLTVSSSGGGSGAFAAVQTMAAMTAAEEGLIPPPSEDPPAVRRVFEHHADAALMQPAQGGLAVAMPSIMYDSDGRPFDATLLPPFVMQGYHPPAVLHEMARMMLTVANEIQQREATARALAAAAAAARPGPFGTYAPTPYAGPGCPLSTAWYGQLPGVEVRTGAYRALLMPNSLATALMQLAPTSHLPVADAATAAMTGVGGIGGSAPLPATASAAAAAAAAAAVSALMHPSAAAAASNSVVLRGMGWGGQEGMAAESADTSAAARLLLADADTTTAALPCHPRISLSYQRVVYTCGCLGGGIFECRMGALHGAHMSLLGLNRGTLLREVAAAAHAFIMAPTAGLTPPSFVVAVRLPVPASMLTNPPPAAPTDTRKSFRGFLSGASGAAGSASGSAEAPPRPNGGAASASTPTVLDMSLEFQFLLPPFPAGVGVVGLDGATAAPASGSGSTSSWV